MAGILSAFALTFFIFIARPLILAFGLPEMLMLAVLGLSMVAILAGRVPLKGIVAAGLGLLAGTIGAAGAGGSLRMSTYDIPYLVDGLQLVIVGLGIYAIPEIVSLLREDESIAKGNTLGAGWLAGMRDWWHNIWLSTKCVGIGIVVGIMPGLGGSVVDWIAYGYTVQSSKDRSMFGKGDIRGVIGPESSANANYGGALIPTLIFGIPGSGSMAIFLGGLALLNLSPGPNMVRQQLAITYTIVWSLALATIIGAAICILLSNQIAKITKIRFAIMAPLLFMMIAFAAFESRQSLGDLVALIAIGFLGILLRRFDYSRPAFLIGFVLSSSGGELHQHGEPDRRLPLPPQLRSRAFLYRDAALARHPGAHGDLDLRRDCASAKHITENEATASGSKRASVIFLLCITAYVAASLIDASTITLLSDKIFPLTVGDRDADRLRRAPDPDAPRARDRSDLRRPRSRRGRRASPARPLADALLVRAAARAFLAVRLHHRADDVLPRLLPRAGRAELGWTLIYSAAGVAAMIASVGCSARDFPPGLLQRYIQLPWPLHDPMQCSQYRCVCDGRTDDSRQLLTSISRILSDRMIAARCRKGALHAD